VRKPIRRFRLAPNARRYEDAPGEAQPLIERGIAIGWSTKASSLRASPKGARPESRLCGIRDETQANPGVREPTRTSTVH